MPDKEPDSSASSRQRQMALSRWDNEGGAGPGGPQGGSVPAEAQAEIPALTNAIFAATGVRYNVTTNAVINTQGGGATYIPGGSAGTASTGGQYV